CKAAHRIIILDNSFRKRNKHLSNYFVAGSRNIILGVFHRQKNEQNVPGNFVVIHFLADSRMEHWLWCFSKQPDNRYLIKRASVQRINRGKRAASDVCAWTGHIAECELEVEDAMIITPEKPLREPRHELVVCMAPMYIYTDWEILLVSLETWLALGATKIIVPIQSASSTTYRILKEYEERGFVIIRTWPKWPILTDSNPNGMVLSRGKIVLLILPSALIIDISRHRGVA
ncbi:unnamed protein product, partial [Strongylus vulgaris]